MAQIANISNSVFDMLLPTFGNEGTNMPIWNEGQRMFISEEYESAAGNRYYKGLRFCEKLAIVETVGLYHTWTYIDSIEVYAFEGRNKKLISKRIFDKQFYNKDFIQEQTRQMVADYLRGQSKMMGVFVSKENIDREAEKLVNKSYTSLLSEEFGTRLTDMMKMLCPPNN